MGQREKLEEAIKHLEEYRKSSLCGYCRQYADITIDTLRALTEIDRNIEQALMAKMKYPGMTEMPKLNRTMHALREKSEKMFGAEGGGQAEEHRQPVRPLARLRENAPLGLRPMIRETRNGFMGIVSSVRPVNMFSGWSGSDVRKRGTARKGTE